MSEKERVPMKRYRTPKMKPGHLMAQYGKLPHDSPDLIFTWGPGCHKGDASLLHYVFCMKQYNPVTGKFDDRSFVDELQSRGYDITTLRFSIEKHQPPQARERG